jgi:hypothetical protein
VNTTQYETKHKAVVRPTAESASAASRSAFDIFDSCLCLVYSDSRTYITWIDAGTHIGASRWQQQDGGVIALSLTLGSTITSSSHQNLVALKSMDYARDRPSPSSQTSVSGQGWEVCCQNGTLCCPIDSSQKWRLRC